MKKSFYLLLSGIFFAAVLVSCTKDKAPTEKFSTLTVEENKATVESTGVDFVAVMKKFKNLQTIDALAEFIDISSSAGSKGSQFFTGSKIYHLLELIGSNQDGTKKVNNIFDGVVNVCKSEDPQSIQQWWDENVGTYSWDSGLNDWNISLGGTKIIFLFPGSQSATSNNATITISNYTGVTFNDPLDPDYTGDFPASINMDLKVGSTTLVTLVAGAEYNSDGIPNAAAADLNIENFKFEIDISNNSKVISATYKFLDGTDVIMNLTASGDGLFTQENYDDNTITHTDTYQYVSDYVWNPGTQQWDPVYSTWTDEWTETEFEEILNSAKAEFSLLNIAMRGEIDIKGLEDQIRIIDAAREAGDITSEIADSRYVLQINKFMNLRLVNTQKNEIIAKVEAYVRHESDEYGSYSYVDFRLVFGDDSRIDLATYTDNGFDSFVAALNDLIDEINADYDVTIDYIDY
jgi:hypothetical protein